MKGDRESRPIKTTGELIWDDVKAFFDPFKFSIY